MQHIIRHKELTRACLALAVVFSTAALFAQTSPLRTPKLAVILVVDQLSYETLERMRPHLDERGIERLFAEGAVFTQALYGHGATYTSPGHTTIASGSYAYNNGIVTNTYYDRVAGKSVPMFADPDYPVLESPSNPQTDSSPRNFIGETVGDRLRVATGMTAKVVAITLKDRAAIALGGRLGSAYWMSSATGKMTTSSYYAKELPAWVKAFNDRKIPDSYFGKVWERALPESKYLGKDDRPFESNPNGLGRTFPHQLTGNLDKPGPAFYSTFLQTPMANDFLVDFVKAAVQAEGLGIRDGTDLLAVSFSANDLIGHAYGPESHEVQDATLRVDRNIADLLDFLEKHVGGKDNLVVVFTADHGAVPIPEYMASLGHPARRIKKAELKKAVTEALTKRFGPGEWVLALEDPSIYLNEKVIGEKDLDPALVQEKAGLAALGVSGIAAYFTRAQLLSGRLPPTPIARAMQVSFHPDRAGDVLLVPRPFYFWGKYGEVTEGSTHGSPYRYDTHVPLAFWGAGIKPGVHWPAVDMADVAPTLAALMHLIAPAAADGTARPEVFQ